MNSGSHNEFDAWIKDAFNGASTPPPPGVWQAVSSQIGAGTTAAMATKTVLLKTTLAKIVAGAVLAGTIATSAYLLYQNNTEKSAEQADFTEKITQQSDKKPGESISSQTAENDSGIPANSVQGKNKNFTNNDRLGKPTAHNNVHAAQGEIQEGGSKANSQNNNNYMANNYTGIPQMDLKNQVEIVTLDSVFCTGEKISLIAAYKPVWEKIELANPGAQLFNNQPQSWVISYNKPGVYQVSILAYRNAGSAPAIISRNLYIRNLSALFQSEITGSNITLRAQEQNAAKYAWSFNGTEYRQTSIGALTVPLSEFSGAGKVLVTLKVSNANCVAVTEQQIQLPVAAKEPFIPNVFTPTEQDGKNDCFTIEMDEPESYFLIIKNRAGEIVFESRNYKDCWNGKVNNRGEMCPQDAYFYQLIYQLTGKEKESKTGRLQLF